MRALIFTFLLIAGFENSWALYEKKENFLSNGASEMVVLHTEESSFFVDRYTVDTEGWQERVSERRFSTQKAAKTYFQTVTKNFKSSIALGQKTLPLVRTGFALWEVKSQWDAQWEQAYIDWVKQNLTADFYVRYNIPTDCADVAYTIRWIFSRIHGLPAAATLAGSEKLFTQDDGKLAWANLPTDPEWNKDQRFLKALQYIMSNTFTHTLQLDSYPVEINPVAIQPGGYHLVLRKESGHTRMINSTNPGGFSNNVISFVASDVPAKVRPLHVEPFGIKKFVYLGEGGFLRFRWLRQQGDASYVLAAPETMPHYSLEQFNAPFSTDYYKTVLSRMGMKNNPKEYLRQQLEVAWQKLNYRVDVVKEGFALCQKENCALGTMNYENWSTPSRDAQIGDVVSEILQTLWDAWSDQNVQREYKKWANKKLQVGNQLQMTFDELINIWDYKKFSSDPNHSIEQRWGVEP